MPLQKQPTKSLDRLKIDVQLARKLQQWQKKDALMDHLK
jgi:hypothetical protein